MSISTESPAGLHPAATWWALAFALILGLAAFLRWPDQPWLKLDFQTLLPPSASSHWVNRSNELDSAAYNQSTVWLIEGQEPEQVQHYSEQLLARLTSGGYLDPGFESAQAELWSELIKTLTPYRRGLLRAEDRQRLENTPDAYFESVRAALYSPLGGTAAALLSTDPTGLFAHYLDTLGTGPAASGSALSRVLVVPIAPEMLGFNRAPALYDFYRSEKRLAEGQEIALYATGAPLFTAYGVHSARAEMTSVGIASLALLTVLLAISLRSANAIFLTALCVGLACCAGLLGTVAVFGHIHIFTLVFGSALIGIAADYAIHYLAHARTPDWRPELALSRVYRGLRLSVLSSTVAFAGLALLPFPGIRQVGLFMAFGLCSAFLTVCLLFPYLFRVRPQPRALARWWHQRPYRWRWAGPALGLALLASLALILTQPGHDDIRAFYAAPKDLEEARKRIAGQMDTTPDTRFILVQALDTQSLLEREETLRAGLATLVQSGKLQGYQGITDLLPSARTQARNAELLTKESVHSALMAHMEILGLEASQQASTIAFMQAPYAALTLPELSQQSLPLGSGGFLGCSGDTCASRVALSGLSQSAAVEALLANHPHATLIDQVADINGQMNRYRGALAGVLLAAAALIGSALTLRFGWRTATGILAVPMASCLFSLLAVSLIHGGYSLVNLLAMLLIAGVSLDYAIFRRFTPRSDQGATALAITLSAATSILAFGLLGLSETPVIRDFGQTITAGLLVAWSLSWLSISAEQEA